MYTERKTLSLPKEELKAHHMMSFKELALLKFTFCLVMFFSKKIPHHSFLTFRSKLVSYYLPKDFVTLAHDSKYL